jgi:nucleotide-binding universal stress UspA family protein
MFKHMLVPTDGSKLSEGAALMAIDLAKSTGAKITGITVSRPFRASTADYVMADETEGAYNGECMKQAALSLDFIANAAKSSGVEYEGVHVFGEQPYASIIDAAGKKGCDAICMASHGRKGVAALVLGSETVKVLTHSKIPVLVSR